MSLAGKRLIKEIKKHISLEGPVYSHGVLGERGKKGNTNGQSRLLQEIASKPIYHIYTNISFAPIASSYFLAKLNLTCPKLLNKNRNEQLFQYPATRQ